jgi:hypothetical protein
VDYPDTIIVELPEDTAEQHGQPPTPTATPDRDVLTPREVADRAGFSYHAILRAIRRGDLEAFEPVPGHYRIEVVEYERWLRRPARRNLPSPPQRAPRRERKRPTGDSPHVKLVDGMWTERPMSTRPNSTAKPLETAPGKPSVGLEPTTPSLPWNDKAVNEGTRRHQRDAKDLQFDPFLPVDCARWLRRFPAGDCAHIAPPRALPSARNSGPRFGQPPLPPPNEGRSREAYAR